MENSSSKLKIVYVIPTMGCGGAEVLLGTIARHLASMGHEVHILCLHNHHETWPNFPEKEALLRDVPLHIIGGSVRFRFLKSPVLDNKAFAEYLDKLNPDVIHAHLYLSELMVSSHLLKGTKYFSHGHDNMPQLRRLGIRTFFSKTLLTNWWERRWLMKQYAKSKTHFIAISKDVEDYLRENCPSLKNRITRVPNAIDCKRFFVQRDYSASKPIFKMLSVGSLVTKKNHAYLIGVAKMLKEKGYSFEINVLGDGPLKQELIQQTIAADCADRLFFRGSVPDVPRWMAESDVYVHPANYEPFGLVLIEAMASGMPVISLDGRGNRGLVENGLTGYFLPVDASPESFANRVEEFICDSEKVRKMGTAAQAFSEDFDIEGYINTLLHLYRA
jgi:glycosyltransferase involved in cell wall biosynthesis